MRFVDGKQRQIAAGEIVQERFGQQSLGRDIDQVVFARTHATLDTDGFGHRQGGVESSRPHAQLPECLDLIMHQGNERRDDDPDALAAQRRYLITQRLAAAGGHQDQGVAAADHMVNDFGLLAAKGIVAEDRPQDVEGIAKHGDGYTDCRGCGKGSSARVGVKGKAPPGTGRRHHEPSPVRQFYLSTSAATCMRTIRSGLRGGSPLAIPSTSSMPSITSPQTVY